MLFKREKELKILNKLFKENKFNLIILSGNRRVGKTALLSEFARNEPCIFFSAVEGNDTINLDILNREISRIFHAKGSFSSFKDALDFLFNISLNKKFILIIDNYPNLVQSYKSINSLLQINIDKNEKRSKMIIILSGSSSFMRNKVVSYEAPLYGRYFWHLKLSQLSFEEIQPLFKTLSNEEKLVYYGTFGGIPYYLNKIDLNKTIKENVKSLFLDNSSFLLEEPINLLKQEVFNIEPYYSILIALSRGFIKIEEISNKTKINELDCHKFLDNLIEWGLVEQEFPYSEINIDESTYKINNYLFRFWFRFIPSNLSLISRGFKEQVYKKIEPYLNEYVGPIFEELAQEYLWILFREGKSPVFFNSLGRWWGTDSKTKSQIEIDIVGEENEEVALFAECKWTNQKVNSNVLKDLIKKSQVFKHIIKHFYIFSKSGFTEDLINLAKEIPNVYLVDLNEMMEIFNL